MQYNRLDNSNLTSNGTIEENNLLNSNESRTLNPWNSKKIPKSTSLFSGRLKKKNFYFLINFL